MVDLTTAMSHTCGIILAGGQSRRMGRDKALLPVGAATFLQNSISLLLGLTPVVFVVTDVVNRYTVQSATVIADIFPDAGPVGGILTGLTAAGPGWHYVVACDMPGIRADVLRTLMQCATDQHDAVAPELNGKLEPLCAVYRDSAIAKLRRFLEDGGRSAQKALNMLNTRQIPWDLDLHQIDPGAQSLLNINTPEDLASFERRHELQ